MKKLLVVLSGTLLLAGALCLPPVLHADGSPMGPPNCPSGKVCKP